MIKTALKKTLHVMGYIASALLIPLGFKKEKDGDGKSAISVFISPLKLAIFIGTYYVLQPLSLFLFPRAETVLKKEGLDPKIVKNLTSAKDIRIIPNTLAGNTYILFKNPPLLRPIYFFKTAKAILLERKRGFHAPNGPHMLASLISPEIKEIYLKKSAEWYDAGDRAFNQGIQQESGNLYKLAPGGNGKDFDQRALLHEIRHTDPDNRSLTPLFCEGDADYQAFKELSVARNDPHFVQKLLWSQSFNNNGPDHNTSLYLYCLFNHDPLPSEAAMRKANADAAPVIDDLQTLYEYMLLEDTAKISSLTEKFNTACKKLSPLAQTRVGLFQDAWKNTVVPMDKKEKSIFAGEDIKPQ